jgi:hypothetical protein
MMKVMDAVAFAAEIWGISPEKQEEEFSLEPN